MTLTLTDYLLLFFGGLSFAVLVCLIFLKQKIKKTSIYKSLRFNNQKIYKLGRFCLAILSFCLTVLSGNQFFQTSNPLILLICSFLAISSLRVFWWNLTYNAEEDPLSSLFFKKRQKFDLRGAKLRGANLIGANPIGADLMAAMGANLMGANLMGASLGRANLMGANLSEANLCDAFLCEANLRDANLTGADLREANLIGADLRDANLSWANLSEADLVVADLRGANLRGANLREANLRDANLKEANLGSWPKVQGVDFTHTKGISPEQRAILIARGAIFDNHP
jgi:uncharacterized protein YjbI with pentapeptide repeats